jgi:hypothetical protein
VKSTIKIDRESKVCLTLMGVFIALAAICITPAAIAAFKPPFAFVAAAVATMSGCVAGSRVAWLLFQDRTCKGSGKLEDFVVAINWLLTIFVIAGLTGYAIFRSGSLTADYFFLAAGIICNTVIGWSYEIVTTKPYICTTQKIIKSDGTF